MGFVFCNFPVYANLSHPNPKAPAPYLIMRQLLCFRGRGLGRVGERGGYAEVEAGAGAGGESARMEPPCCWMTCRAMKRRRPVPLWPLEEKRVKSFFGLHGAQAALEIICDPDRPAVGFRLDDADGLLEQGVDVHALPVQLPALHAVEDVHDHVADGLNYEFSDVENLLEPVLVSLFKAGIEEIDARKSVLQVLEADLPGRRVDEALMFIIGRLASFIRDIKPKPAFEASPSVGAIRRKPTGMMESRRI